MNRETKWQIFFRSLLALACAASVGVILVLWAACSGIFGRRSETL
ncbi:MAG: hypothetical protein PHW60_16495 [Kiritimatiellae bacterium]|nr:hypothetical protein [Kiritimatiellia bacterium]